MKLKIPLPELLPRLQLVSKFTAERDIVPALTYLYFKGTTIRAYSGISGATVNVPWDFGPGFAISSERLMNVLNRLSDRGMKEVSLSMEAPGKPLVIKSAKSVTSHETLPEDALSDFVLREPSHAGEPVKVSLEFWSDVARVELSVCDDGAKPMLCGVFWGPTGKIMSADGKRMSIVYPVKGRQWEAPGDGVLMPSHLLNRLGSEKYKIKEIQVEGDNLLWFHFDDASVWGQLLESPFPAERSESIVKETKAAIKTGEGTWVGFDNAGRQALISILDLMFPFANDTELFALKSKIVKGEMEVMAGAGNTTAYDSLDINTQGPGGEFTVNGKFFKQIVEQVGTTRFWYSGLTPLYFLSEDKRMEHLLLLLSAPTGHSNAQPAPETDESF